jgi:hypothetical protein
MIIPSVFLLIIVNLVVSSPVKSNPKKRLEEALAAGNNVIAKAEYHKLIQDDFFKVEYHRGSIRSHFGQHGRRSDLNSQANQNLIEGYRRYAAAEEKSNLTRISSKRVERNTAYNLGAHDWF